MGTTTGPDTDTDKAHSGKACGFSSLYSFYGTMLKVHQLQMIYHQGKRMAPEQVAVGANGSVTVECVSMQLGTVMVK